MATVATPRRRSGAVATSLVGFAFAVVMLGTTLPTPLYPALETRFGFAELTTTVVFAVYPVGVVAALWLWGRWSDQLGRRPLLLGGLALSALSAVCFLLPASMGWVYLARFLSGLSAGVYTGTATATIVDLAHDDGDRAGLVAAAVNMTGLGLGPLLAGVLAQWAPAPLRTPFAVDLVLVALAAAALLTVPETVRRAEGPRLRPQAVAVPPDLRPRLPPGRHRRLRRLRRDRALHRGLTCVPGHGARPAGAGRGRGRGCWPSSRPRSWGRCSR